MSKKNKKSTPEINLFLLATGTNITEKNEVVLQQLLYDVIDEIGEAPTGFIFIPKDGEHVRVSILPPNKNSYVFNWVIAVENYGYLSNPKIWGDGHSSYTCFDNKEVTLTPIEVSVEKTIENKTQFIQIWHKLNQFQYKALHNVIEFAFEKTREIINERQVEGCKLNIGFYTASTYLETVLNEVVENVLNENEDETQELMDVFLSASTAVDMQKELGKNDFEFTKDVDGKKLLN